MYRPYNRTEHCHQDWIRRTIDLMIAEFEARSLNLQHSESWYMARLWTMIDRVFADVEDLEADEGIWGTKKLLEKGVKAAKTLKDMLNHLRHLVDNVVSSVRQLRTIGYILSGLSMELMITDSPMGYCCRITRSKLFSIPKSALQVRSKLHPLMSALISTKLLVVQVIDEVDNHGLNDVDLEESLAYSFQEEPSMTGSPNVKRLSFHVAISHLRNESEVAYHK
ncbi:hypothetical protein K450DRAFT_276039 [Umbelopsis ramanniana AG]|uniref:Uncharacterized protein n=1 Tax=Umbelopsis ramanniana AG TaxID=1314678 RepID=A0AAD5E1B0_UMBRA|nr:uncharacterized protein K450DRAFT_276039 [Umbelopsis ramanniana AG]KAI8574974.1 hypothetical protein K450DRAFT_276039 [Umbelopsis ramanniana AG]